MGPKLDLNLKSQLVSLKKLKKYLYEDKKFGAASEFNCAGSVCRAISRNTGAIIPIPINFSPLGSAIYFSLARLIPGSRIEKIAIYKKNKLIHWDGYDRGKFLIDGAGTAATIFLYYEAATKLVTLFM